MGPTNIARRCWACNVSAPLVRRGFKRRLERGALRGGGTSVASCFTPMGRRIPKRLAEKLLQIREALGLSQKEMAEQLGLHRTHHHISKYERGKAVPFMEVLLTYSRLANVTIDQIVDDHLDVEISSDRNL